MGVAGQGQNSATGSNSSDDAGSWVALAVRNYGRDLGCVEVRWRVALGAGQAEGIGAQPEPVAAATSEDAASFAARRRRLRRPTVGRGPRARSSARAAFLSRIGTELGPRGGDGCLAGPSGVLRVARTRPGGP